MRSGRPRGPGKALQIVGGFAPTFLKAFPGPRGRPDFNNALKKPGQTAFRYPAHALLGRMQDKQKTPALDLSVDFRPSGPTAGPVSPGNGSA